MNCPVCASDKIKIPWSVKQDAADIRTHICDDCGTRFKSKAEIIGVYVFNPTLLKQELIPIANFTDKYLDFALHKGKHPKQQEISFDY